MVQSQQGHLRARTVTGLFWSLASQVGQQGIFLIILLVMARLLDPRDFGLMAMISIIIGLIRVLIDFGFGAALVQRQDIVEQDWSTVFWFNVVFGLVVTAMVVGLAPAIARFYDQPKVEALTIALALNFLIGSLCIVQRNQMIKSMQFKLLARIEVLGTFFAGFAAIICALLDWGVWSLVVLNYVLSVSTVVLMWMRIDWRPLWVFEMRTIRKLFSYSAHLLGTHTLGHLARNFDKLIIGRYLGAWELGIYQNATLITMTPIHNFCGVIAKVMFPGLAEIQQHKDRVAIHYLQMMRCAALFAFPAMVGICVTARSFVTAVLSDQWLEMIPILQVLSLARMMTTTNYLQGAVLMAMGRSDWLFRLDLFQYSVSILAVLMGLRWGIMGISLCLFGGILLSYIPVQMVGGRSVGVGFWAQMKNLKGVLLCTLAMGAVVSLMDALLFRWLPDVVLLPLDIATGMTLYWLLIRRFRLVAYTEAKSILADWRKRSGRAEKNASTS